MGAYVPGLFAREGLLPHGLRLLRQPEPIRLHVEALARSAAENARLAMRQA